MQIFTKKSPNFYHSSQKHGFLPLIFSHRSLWLWKNGDLQDWEEATTASEAWAEPEIPENLIFQIRTFHHHMPCLHRYCAPHFLPFSTQTFPSGRNLLQSKPSFCFYVSGTWSTQKMVFFLLFFELMESGTVKSLFVVDPYVVFFWGRKSLLVSMENLQSKSKPKFYFHVLGCWWAHMVIKCLFYGIYTYWKFFCRFEYLGVFHKKKEGGIFSMLLICPSDEPY